MHWDRRLLAEFSKELETYELFNGVQTFLIQGPWCNQGDKDAKKTIAGVKATQVHTVEAT